RTPYLKRAW
ncbi:homogentisate 1,2-dioxygenase family protein, partial [Vibrio parahaemolyticus V-223/04]